MEVALYARVSTEKQEKQETIQSQVEALREFAGSNNYIIAGEYLDEGYSGEILDRPALDKLRDEATKKAFKAVLIHSPDRLARKYIYQGLIQEELKRYAVDIIFINHPQSKDTPEDNLLNGMQGLIAEYEKAKILERTRRGRLHKARKGFIVSGIGPYGYTYIFKDRMQNKEGYYEVNTEEAIVVRLIFDLFVDKQMSIRGIARELTQRGIRPRKGKHWRTSTLHKIIRNQTYTGITHYNKHIATEALSPRKDHGYRRRKNSCLRLRPQEQWIPVTLPEHLKIIDSEIFGLAQKQLEKNSQVSPRNVKYRYLLRGLLQCGDCNAPYVGSPCHGKLYYRCGDRGRTFPLPKKCNAPSLSAPMLENVVWSAVSTAIQQPKLIIEQIKKLQAEQSKHCEGTEAELERIKKALENTQLEEDRLLDAYRSNIISIEQLKTQMDKIKEKRITFQKEKNRLNDMLNSSVPPELLEENITNYFKLIRVRLGSLTFEEKQQILRLLVDKIVLEKETIRIKGIIPLYNIDGNIELPPEREDKPPKTALCHIASTVVGCCERNTTFEYELVASLP